MHSAPLAAARSTPVRWSKSSYSLRVGNMRQRGELAPKHQIWCRSALAWAKDIADLPQSEKS